MNTGAPLSPAPDPNRRGLLAVVGLLACVLVVGGIFVVKAFFGSAAPAGAGSLRNGAAAIEAGLEAAAQYQREHKYPEAIAILDKLSEQSPSDRAVRIAYAQALIGQHKHAEAYKQYEAAIALSAGPPIKPNDDKALTGLGMKRDPLLAQLHYEAGTSANMADLYDRAEEHYWMAQVLDTSEPRYPLFLAMMQIKKGDDAAAAASLLRAVKLNPDLAEGWGTMAELELRKNQLSLAAQHIEKARKLQPELSRWRIVQARIFGRSAEPEKAAALLQALPQSDRLDKSVLSLQAECYGLMKRPADAAAMYESVSRQVPTDPEFAYQAALWYQRAGDKANAAKFAMQGAMLGNESAKELVATLKGE